MEPFSITYFKVTGKFYTSATFDYPNVRKLPNGEPYMEDAYAKVRGWRDTGGQGALPGLSGEGWEGFIVVDHPEGFPRLLLPRKD